MSGNPTRSNSKTGPVKQIKPETVKIGHNPSKPNATRQVEVGDVIRFPKRTLQHTQNFEYIRFFSKNGEGLQLKERSFRTVKADYKYWAFTFKDESMEEHRGTIYVQGNQPEVWNAFWKKVKSGGEGQDYDTVVVDNDFQYGQNKNGEMRFLVFHNKKTMPFQHRFVSGKSWRFMKAIYKHGAVNLDEVYGFVDEMMSTVAEDIIDVAKEAAGGALTFLPMAYHGLMIANKVFSIKTRLLATVGDYLKDFQRGEPKWFDHNEVAVAYDDKVEVDIKKATPLEVGDAESSKVYILLNVTNPAPGRNPDGFMLVEQAKLQSLKTELLRTNGKIVVGGRFYFDRLYSDPPQRLIVYGSEGSLYPQTCYSHAFNQYTYACSECEFAAEALTKAQADLETAKAKVKDALEAEDAAIQKVRGATGRNKVFNSEAKKATDAVAEAKTKLTEAEAAVPAAESAQRAAEAAKEALVATEANMANNAAVTDPEALLLGTRARHVVKEKAKPLSKFALPTVKEGDTIEVHEQDPPVTVPVAEGKESTDYIVLEFKNKEVNRQPTGWMMVEKSLKSSFFVLRDAGQKIKVDGRFRAAAWTQDETNRILIYQDSSKRKLSQKFYLEAIKHLTHPDPVANPATGNVVDPVQSRPSSASNVNPVQPEKKSSTHSTSNVNPVQPDNKSSPQASNNLVVTDLTQEPIQRPPNQKRDIQRTIPTTK